MYAVIMAGGRGTRFWPLSREKNPKHLLNITGDKTILETTIERIKPLIPENYTYIITGESHVRTVIDHCGKVPRENIIIEPIGRNTAPCIGLAATYIKQKDPDAVMVVLPADHLIFNEERFLDNLTVAADMARKERHLITVGIRPTKPETAYGYIEEGTVAATIRGKEVYRVRSFREKPDRETARQFLDAGRFFWNSGMFIWRVSTILDAIEEFLPKLHQGLTSIAAALGTDRERNVIEAVYNDVEPLSIDYGVMEKAKDVILIKGDFGWNDIGSWDALFEIFSRDGAGNSFKGNVIAVDSQNSLVYSPDKLVTLIGVSDLVVVETDDALLICRRDNSQDVKDVVEILKAKGLKDYV